MSIIYRVISILCWYSKRKTNLIFSNAYNSISRISRFKIGDLDTKSIKQSSEAYYWITSLTLKIDIKARRCELKLI